MLDLAKVKKVILTWTYTTLNEQFPDYFNDNDYTNISGAKVINSPNVYWSNTITDRPLDATLCYLTISSDESYTLGTDGTFYFNDNTQKFYYKITEPHEIMVRFSVVSMKNKSLNLSALQAQNLAYNACSYLKMMLKTGSASDYFTYDNDIVDEPILVCTQPNNMTGITEISEFEDTKDKFTYQFSCKFKFDLVTEIEKDKALKVHGTITPDSDPSLAQDFDIELQSD